MDIFHNPLVMLVNSNNLYKINYILTDIFEKAQQAADLYLENIKAIAEQTREGTEESVTARQICKMIKDIDEQ